jgi:CRISPR-associated endonuclease Csn1
MAEKNFNDSFILGLDIGSNSIGWALVECEKDKPRKLLRAGVRVFDAGTDGDIESGGDVSRGKDRRDARQRRRMLQRRSMRLHTLASELQISGLLPPGDISNSSARNSYFADLDRALADGLPDLGTLPFRLRAAALDKPMKPHEIGRALYHLAQRRGFLSGRKQLDEKKKKEEGVVKDGIGKLAEEMRAAGARTLGEFFSRLDPHEHRIRARYTSRQMHKDEFNAIWIAQSPHYPDPLNDSNRKKIESAIFFQRPLKVQKNLIGRCELEPKCKRAPWDLLIAQRFRLLQKVNDLRIKDIETTTGVITERTLTPEERELLLETLELHGDQKFTTIRRKLFNIKSKHCKFNHEEGDEEKIRGNRTAAALAAVLGEKKWKELKPEEKEKLVEDVRGIHKRETRVRRGTNKWGLNPEQAEKFADIGLESGYCALSRKALEKIVPLMENGVQFATARKQLYGDPPPVVPVDFLPPVTSSKMPDLRNPVVARTLTELRKVVNAVVREHGKPGLIRIELARDLKKPRKEREAIWKRNRANQKARDKAILEIIKETGIQRPSGADIEKYLLAEECGWICPYTGMQINMASLFGPNPQFDIEHIIPFSRCLENSFLNKTLCHVDANRNVKRNRTPWEAYGNTPEWESILHRVEKFRADTDVKLKRFKLENIEDIEQFSSRQLNDTKYSSKLAVRYMGLLYGAGVEGNDSEGRKRIQAGRGQVTHFLRDVWDLNRILGDGGTKNRDDHRHHAVDAVCIALTSPTTVKDLSAAAARATVERRRRFARVEPPWPDFHGDVIDTIDKMPVSHRVSRKVNGRMHKESIYGKPHTNEQGHECVHIRKKLTGLSKHDIENIVDPNVRSLVREALGDGDPAKMFSVESNLPFFTAKKTGRRIPIRNVRVAITDSVMTVGAGARERRVIAGANQHVEIFEITDAKGRLKWEGRIVTVYEAMRRKRMGEPIVDRTPQKEWENGRFVFSLSGGDTFELDTNTETERELFVARSISIQKAIQYIVVEYVSIREARKIKEIKADGKWNSKGLDPLRKLKCRKVVVTPLGEIIPSHE